MSGLRVLVKRSITERVTLFEKETLPFFDTNFFDLKPKLSTVLYMIENEGSSCNARAIIGAVLAKYATLTSYKKLDGLTVDDIVLMKYQDITKSQHVSDYTWDMAFIAGV